MGTNLYDIFVDTNNTVYLPDVSNRRVLVWFEGNSSSLRNVSVGLSEPERIFVTTSGDIYLDISNTINGVSKWRLDSSTTIPIISTCRRCSDLFVDIDDTLYCSMAQAHQVVTHALNSSSNTLTIVAGMGVAGNASHMLNEPQGIFVDTNLNLYVADSQNHRIQLFRHGETNGITVAGSGSTLATITLNYPTAVILDADRYLFIADSLNHRIVGSGPNDFRCIVGCSGVTGSTLNQLNQPWSLSLDSYGNIFVTDRMNRRIQKFSLMTNSCSKYKI